MIVKKSGGQIIGAHLTAAERKAMDLEIRRQAAEFDRKKNIEVAAMVLWVLHEEFEFGPKKARRYFDKFNPLLDDLVKRYEFERGDELWVCTHKLKECGIDIEQWMKEST